MAADITRHDIPNSIRNLIVVAQEALELDTWEIYALAANYGADWLKLTETLCDYGFANRHANSEAHRRIVEAAEGVWLAVKK